MATRPKAVIESRNGEKFSPITIAKNVLTDDGQNLHDILSDRKEDIMTPTIENSSSMFKVGQGDNVDYNENVVDGAYESLVFKGKSLVNLLTSLRPDTHSAWVRNGSSFTLNASGVLFLNYTVLLKPNTTYTVVGELDFDIDGIVIGFREGNKSWEVRRSVGSRGRFAVLIPTSVESTSNALTVHREVTANSDRVTLSNLMVLEGDWTNKELPPYFEGICDCKSPILSNVGKNLFDVDYFVEKVNNPNVCYKNEEGSLVIKGSYHSVKINIPYSTTITYLQTSTNTANNGASIFEAQHPDGTCTHIGVGVNTTLERKTWSIKKPIIAIGFNNWAGGENILKDIMLVKTEDSTAYEPYKSNILSCETYFDETTQSDKTIVLRSLPNGLCDTLNVRTGEYVQRIGEVNTKSLQTTVNLSTGAEANVVFVNGINGKFIGWNECNVASDKLQWTYRADTNWSKSSSINGIAVEPNGGFWFIVDKTIETKEQANEFLVNLDATIQYELATPIVKQINIEGYPYAYENGHILLESGSIEQSLTPTIEYSVVTNRNGQIRSNQKMVERHQKQLDRLQAMVLINLVNTQYEQTLTNLKYDLKNVR